MAIAAAGAALSLIAQNAFSSDAAVSAA